jgi:integrase
LREFRTVDASRMLRAVAKEKDLTKTTLQHIKSVLSTIFTYAKNEGAFDGANPVDGVLIPWNAREPGETHAYDLGQVLQILDLLPLLAKSLVATAAFAGLRRGELRGLEWTDYTGTELRINRSMWRSVVSLPKTRASRDSVPIIPPWRKSSTHTEDPRVTQNQVPSFAPVIGFLSAWTKSCVG